MEAVGEEEEVGGGGGGMKPRLMTTKKRLDLDLASGGEAGVGVGDEEEGGVAGVEGGEETDLAHARGEGGGRAEGVSYNFLPTRWCLFDIQCVRTSPEPKCCTCNTYTLLV